MYLMHVCILSIHKYQCRVRQLVVTWFYFLNNYSYYREYLKIILVFLLIVIHMFYMHNRLLTNSLVEMTLQLLNKLPWFNNFNTDTNLWNCYLILCILCIIMQYKFQQFQRLFTKLYIFKNQWTLSCIHHTFITKNIIFSHIFLILSF